MRVIISGGGTGGHIFPAVAIANTIKEKEPQSEILFVGAENRMEMQKVPAAGYKIIGLHIAGFNRENLVKNFSLPFKLLSCLLKCRRIIKDFKPDIVIGVGGYASFSIVFTAQKLGITTLLQEQNSLAGKSNQILGKKAKRICVAYDNMQRYFPINKIVFTGNPLRNIVSTTPKISDNKTCFVMGGSLGARTINNAVEKNLQYFIDNDLHLIWQTGKTYYNDILQRTHNLLTSNHKAQQLIEIKEFIFDMEKAYRSADFIISRAGALSISELCVVGKPTILIPSPNVAEDHQTKNAMALVEKNAALMVKDGDLQADPTILAQTISQLMTNESLQKDLSSNIKQLGVTDANERIYQVIRGLV